MFRLNPFVRVGLCLSAISCAWPVLAVDDDGETMVVTASSVEQNDAPRDKCTLSCAINGIHAAFHYLKKNYISGCVMTVPTGW